MLIKDTAQLKAVLGGIQKTMQWPTWQPFVEQAELKYIIPAIGDELYEELSALSSPTGRFVRLLKHLQIATAYYAYFIGLPQMVSTMGDGGVSVSNPAQAQPMGKWLYVSMKKDIIANANRALEDALFYLESYEADFTIWKQSAAYSMTHGSFLHSATELTRYFPHAQKSRRLYLAQRDYIRKAEDFFLQPLLGKPFAEDLKAKLVDATYSFTEEETHALQLIRFALANESFRESIPFLNITEDWRLLAETDGITNEDYLPSGRREELALQAGKEAEKFAGLLKNYLDQTASPTVLAAYYNSPAYTPPVQKTATGNGFPNDPNQNYFVL
ncbi:DUF6712 family protein [Larkinella terrae]|uniref:Uncharacterized protein n=1 Tax=Larkinella terrae TaxID=2025311 RepID=A0A7K0EJ98_9BACT|nr:DUF6712 family protein [Larkinella terrae]MRS61887.1 hypothetical protein [Larkinella terrae]